MKGGAKAIIKYRTTIRFRANLTSPLVLNAPQNPLMKLLCVSHNRNLANSNKIKIIIVKIILAQFFAEESRWIIN